MDKWGKMMAHIEKMEANNNLVDPNVLQQHTNKSFLIGKHTDGMDFIAKKLTSDLKFLHHTVTPDIKYSDAVPLDVKNSIQIKDLLKSINKPIDGKFLLCRTICPPCKMTALMTVVDDPDGKLATKILLYNFVPSVSHLSHEDAYNYLPVGSILAIMNPWFKPTVEGGVAVRCDNPSHVVRLNSSKFDHIVGGLTWKGQIPREFQMNVDKTTALDWKMKGNDHFTSKRFNESIEAYTKGIDSERERSKLWLDLLSNRSAAYLKLCYYNLALTDAQSVLDVDKSHMKCILWRANALLGMGRYEDALSFLKNLSLDISKDNQKIIDHLISKGQRLIAQSRTGDYPWKDILSNKLPEYCHDIAEYNGTVVVKESPNKGRGLFATETIKAGQLILASRAFAIAVTEKRDEVYLNSKNTKSFNTRSQTELVTIIAQILKNCPEKCAEFYNLYGGVEYIGEKSSQNIQVDVDIKRIGEICHYNSFGCGTFTSENDVSGIWIYPSFINHSCVDSNSFWERNGNFIFVRAFHDIPKGEEILICYLTPFGNMIQNKLQQYGFTCDCRLCKRDRLDSPKIQAIRSDLYSKLGKILDKIGSDKFDLDYRECAEGAATIINLLNESRADAPELNIFFLGKVKAMALMHYGNGSYLTCASTLQHMYNTIENLAAFCDFTLAIVPIIISSYLMVGDKKSATTWFEILKQKAALYYGSLDSIEHYFAGAMGLLKESGLYKGK